MEIPVYEITTEQRVEFSIRAALLVYKETSFVSWAEKWLSGEDRSETLAFAAYVAAHAAYIAAYSAYVVAHAAHAAYIATSAAVYATDTVAHAAHAAYVAAHAAVDTDKFNQQLIEICNTVFG